MQLQGFGAPAARGALQPRFSSRPCSTRPAMSALALLLEKPSRSAMPWRDPPADQKVVSSNCISSAVRRLQGANALSPMFFFVAGLRSGRRRILGVASAEQD